MQNLAIIRTFKVKAKFTIDQWQLYEDADYACRELNKGLMLSVNTHSNRTDVEREMEGLMFIHRAHGANDSEPHHFLSHILDFIYGNPEEE